MFELFRIVLQGYPLYLKETMNKLCTFCILVFRKSKKIINEFVNTWVYMHEKHNFED